MRRGTILQMEMPHREPMKVLGFVIGDEHAQRSCAIVGATRGNEAQQAFICARLVARLAKLELGGLLGKDKNILVIPCVNPYSMNILHRFWPADNTDINRMFPGDEHGDTTERIAAGILRVVRTYAYGIQMCSFNQPGDFLPHVRIAHQGPISSESLAIAPNFGLPYVLHRNPSPYDRLTLNYAWQEAGTHAFSVYSRATDRLDEQSAREVEEAVLRFLAARGIICPPGDKRGMQQVRTPMVLDESELVDIRTSDTAGFFVTLVQAGDHVTEGQDLAQIRDVFDARVLSTLKAPVSGRVFFMRNEPLVQQHMVVCRLVADS